MRKNQSFILQNFHQRLAFDRAALQSETPWLIGVDEVGRGPLAGPVVAAAVAMSAETLTQWEASPPEALLRLNDSKKLSPPERQRLSEALLSMPDVITAQGWLSAQDVDRLNIHHATLKAMGLALNALSEKLLFEKLPLMPPVRVLIDGKWPVAAHWLADPLQTWPQKPVIQGDAQSLVIAAASVIAKHHRDAWMITLGQDFPEYDWAQNKGYGTLKHRTALATHGVTPYHRHSFLKKLYAHEKACPA